MPTILSYVGLHFKVPGESGHSLKPIIHSGGKDAPARPTYFLTYAEPTLLPPQWMSMFWSWAETKRSPSLMGLVEGNLKVITSGSRDALRVYRLDAAYSRAEEIPSKDVNLVKLTGYREDFDSWFKATNRGLAPQGHLTKEDLEMLKSLGYATP